MSNIDSNAENSTLSGGFANALLADSGRYILFLIDSKVKSHDGMIFSSYADAKEYAIGCLDGIYADKAVIGFFSMNPNVKEMLISCVETIGFRGDKKNITQLELFGNHFR